MESLIKKIHSLVSEIVDVPKAFVPGETPIFTGSAVYDSREINAIIDSILCGWWGAAGKTKEFESEISKYLGNSHSIFVNSGSSANLLALNAIKVQKGLAGGEIITPACTFPTTLNPIIQLGFTPHFVDIDSTLNISPEQTKAAVNSDTVGIYVSHTLGNPCKIKELLALAKERKLFLLEDSCDAFGSTFAGRRCGGFGDASTLSFYAAHNINTGEGGAVSTKDSGLARILRSLRDWGRDCFCEYDEKSARGACGKRFSFEINGIPYDHRYIYSQIGYNMKPLELQAAMGVIQLSRLEEFNQRRQRNYLSLRKGLERMKVPLDFPEVYSESIPVFFGFPVAVRDGNRKEVLHFLNSKKIATRLLFAGNILRQPAYRKILYNQTGNLEKTDDIAKRGFWIGCHHGMGEEQVEYVLSKFKEYFKK